MSCSSLVLDCIRQEKIIAIVRGVEKELCMAVVEALYQGGIRLVEITYDQNHPDSWTDTAATIAAISESYKEKMLVGAGTVTKSELVKLTYDAGGLYIISPNVNIEVVKTTKQLGMISIPGAMTPSEILQAYDAGADFVKLFPAANLGIPYLKAIRSPINHIPLIATGGINAANAKGFLDAGSIGLGVGGSLTDKKAIADGAFDKLTVAEKELIAIIHS